MGTRWIMAGVGAFVAIFLLDMVIHGHLLMGLYTQTASVWRPQADAHQKMWLMALGQLVFGLLFAWIYTKGYESAKAGIGLGLRYGLTIGALLGISYITVWYVVLPVPFALALGWTAGILVDCLVAGAVVGLLYRRG
jgi:hypothetical protein